MNEIFPPKSAHCGIRFTFAVALLMMSLIMATPTSVLAQWRPPIYRVVQPRETGLRLGKGRLHALLGAYTSYDTNALYAAEDPQRDFVFRLIPGLNFNWETYRYRLLAGYRFTYEDYLEQSVQDNFQHKAVFDLGFDINRRMVLNFSEVFEKTSDPADVEILERLDRIENKADIELLFKTPGADLDLGLKYSNIYRRYAENNDSLSFFNNRVSLTSRIKISSNFRFLPKSVLHGNLQWGTTNYLEANTNAGAANDSQGVSGNLGISSPLSRALRVSLGVGMSSIFFSSGPNATSITGKFDAQYRLGEFLLLEAGYERLTQVATFTNFYEGHIVNTKAELHLRKRFKIEWRNRLAWLDFSGPSVIAGGAQRNDFTIQTQVAFTYAVLPWCDARLAYQMDRRDTNAVDPILGTQTADFLRNRVDLGVEIVY